MKLAVLIILVSLAAAQCPPTTGAAISACAGTAPAPICGFPGYLCARQNATTQVVDSMVTVPPSAGANTCTAGANGHLQACGNLNGTNTIISDPAYSTTYANSHIVRISDYSDVAAGCAPSVGQGGDAGYNVFDQSDRYLIVNCGGNSRIKWLNADMTVNTSVNAQGYVTRAGTPWSTPTSQIRADWSSPGLFYYIIGNALGYVVFSGGTFNSDSPPTPNSVSFAYAIPCWSMTGALADSCPDWQANHAYNPGDNVLPSAGASGHSFQLLSSTACTSGASAPNWAAAIALATSTSQGVLSDGNCQWADMWIPGQVGIGPNTGTWIAGFSMARVTSGQTNNLALSNNGSQDGAGACYETTYRTGNPPTFQHLNTCTGNVYTTICNGAGPILCTAGGQFWSRTYVGNVYTANPFSAGRNNRINIHNSQMSMNGQWVNISFNNCALVDSSGPVNCTSPVTNQYYWLIGTTRMLNALEWLATGTPGHDVQGFSTYMHKNQSTYVASKYVGRTIPVSGVTGGSSYSWFDVSQFHCTPNPCWEQYSSTNTNMSQTFDWDQHSSWVSNPGADNTPICTSIYNQSSPMGGQFPTVTTHWFPPQWPWLGEVVCFQTDGSNRVARQAFQWNSQTSPDFGSTFSIGSLSPDGAYWAFNSDWWCTLGSKTGSATNTCGLPLQVNHQYAVGEYVGAPLYNPVVANIYQVTTAGTTDGIEHGRAFWTACSTSGCTLTVGSAVLTYQGQANQLSSVFVVKLQ